GLFQSPDPTICPNVSAGVLTSIDGCRRAPFQKQEWGGTLGGPFIKDKTFWFGSFEKTHQELSEILTPPSGVAVVPEPTDEILWSVKLDQQITKDHRASARFNVQRQKISNLLVQVPSTAF